MFTAENDTQVVFQVSYIYLCEENSEAVHKALSYLISTAECMATPWRITVSHVEIP